MIKHGVIKWAPVYISSMGSKSEYPTVSFNGDRSLICDTLWCYVVPIKIQFKPNCSAKQGRHYPLGDALPMTFPTP